MKRIIMALMGCATLSAMAQERTVENPEYETKSHCYSNIKSVTFGGDTTRVTFEVKDYNPRWWFIVDSRSTICTGTTCMLPIGVEGVRFDAHMHTKREDSTLVYSILYPHIDASTESLTWLSRGQYDSYESGVQLQGGSTAGRAMQEKQKKALMAEKGGKKLETPVREPGVAVLKGKIYCANPLEQSGYIKIRVNSPYTMTVADAILVKIDEDGAWRAEVPLYVGTQAVGVNIPSREQHYQVLLTAGKESEMNVDEYEKAHAGCELPEAIYFGGANSDVNNVMVRKEYTEAMDDLREELSGVWKTMEGLEAYYDKLMGIKASWEKKMDKMEMSGRAREYVDLQMKRNISGWLLNAKHSMKIRYYDEKQRRVVMTPELRDSIENLAWPESYKAWWRGSELNDPKNLMIYDNIYRDMKMSLSVSKGLTMRQRGEMILEYAEKLESEQKAIATRIAEAIIGNTGYEPADEKEIEVIKLLNTNTNDGFRAIYEKYAKANETGAEKEYADILGVKEGDMALDLYRISQEGDCIFFEGKPVSEERLAELSKTTKTEYMRALRMSNDMLIAKQEARKPLTGSNAHDEGVGAETLLKLREAHPDKVLLVEFWGTWCAACVMMNKAMEPLKEKYADKVLFVYIADETSGKADWEKEIANISGEHYRLTTAEADELKKRLAVNMEAYPTSAIIDKEGGVHETRDVIDDLDSILSK